MKKFFRRLGLIILILLFVLSPSDTITEFYTNKSSTPYPIQKNWGSMDFVKSGAHIKNSYNVMRPKEIRGLYITGWTAGSPRFEELVKIAKENGINTFVIDVKDASGYLSYNSGIPLADEIHSNRNKIPLLQRTAAECIKNGIFPIARIVVFKDPVLAEHKKNLVVKKQDGAIYYDRSGLPWVDPYSKTVWNYNVSIAKDVIAAGFREIQFDYVRFPAVPQNSNLIYPANKNNISKADNIANFLKYATDTLHAYGIKVEADVFGLVLSNTEDLGIGQNLEKMSEYADYICPMVYPSHYWRGSFGYSDPDANPYGIINHALNDGLKRLEKINSKCKLIPYLQDFSLYHHYGKEQILLEKKAVYDNNIKSWFMWNAANVYTIGALKN